jgi:tRNA dimethylallyltransferase
MSEAERPPRLLVIAGPTASGKTAAALALARHWPIEIISVDSALIYRGMDIGTAKPSAAEQAQVPHHLIDIRDPSESYSAAEFMRDVEPLITAIRARGCHPVIAGGTMLYLKAWLDGLDEMPSADLAVRAGIDAQAAAQGWPALHAQLAEVDPISAQRLSPNDGQRISRALEVYRSSGQTLSSFQRGASASQWGRVHLIALEPNDRAWLHQRITQRFEAMVAQGFREELAALRARGDLHLAQPSMRCVGYRQGWEALDAFGTWTDNAHAQWLERGTAATRQLAKRQLTWLRSMAQRHVIAADAPDALAQVVAQAHALWVSAAE